LAKAFVLINAEVGAERDVLNAVLKVPEVKEAYVVYGASLFSYVCLFFRDRCLTPSTYYGAHPPPICDIKKSRIE
jgi:hypothetical protein